MTWTCAYFKMGYIAGERDGVMEAIGGHTLIIRLTLALIPELICAVAKSHVSA